MPRSSVYRLRNGALFLDCQADALSHLATRVVAPLVPVEGAPAAFPRLNPRFDLAGRTYVLATHLLGAVPIRELGAPIGSLVEHDREILNALDVLLTGI